MTNSFQLGRDNLKEIRDRSTKSWTESKERLFTIPNEIGTRMNGKEMFIQQIWNGKKTLNCESSHYKIPWGPK